MVGWHRQLNRHRSEQTPGESEDREAWYAAVHGVTRSQTPPVPQPLSDRGKLKPAFYPLGAQGQGERLQLWGEDLLCEGPWGSLSSPETLEGWTGPEAGAHGPEPTFRRRGL